MFVKINDGANDFLLNLNEVKLIERDPHIKNGCIIRLKGEGTDYHRIGINYDYMTYCIQNEYPEITLDAFKKHIEKLKAEKNARLIYEKAQKEIGLHQLQASAA